MPNENKSKYDLEERTAVFGEKLILFLKGVPENTLNRPIVSQLVRSGTSIGANYCEADGAESKRDFQHKMAICKKEAKETTYWIRMLSLIQTERKEDLRILWKEARELTLIFSKILINSKITK